MAPGGAGCDVHAHEGTATTRAGGGSFTSAVLDLGTRGSLTGLTIAGSGTLLVQLAAASSAAGPWTYVNYDGTTGAPGAAAAELSARNPVCTTVEVGTRCPLPAGLGLIGNHVRYRAELTAGTAGATTVLDAVALAYDGTCREAVLNGLRVDGTAATVTWRTLAWVRDDVTADDPASRVAVRLRVACTRS